tara:strand:- start:4105 stop:5004 length:900 start_codon:yes stop_codon:yes gene_type:complete
MSKNTTSTQEPKDDNLMGMLNTFNEGPASSTEVNVENEIESKAEETIELSEKEITQKEEAAVEEVKEWLIDNKFEDTEEGRSKLADAYKNIQSAKDKAEVELRDKSSKYEKLEVIDSWLQKNPDIVEKLQKEATKQEVGGSPKKPEDYEILEEGSEGSSSQVWRQEYDQWLIDQGAKKAMNQFEGVRQKESQVKARQAEVTELKSLGMTEEEIKSYYGFMKSPENVTTSNMVKVWKVLNEKQESVNSPSDKEQASRSKVLEMEKVQSGASVEGKPTPVKKPADKELDDFMKGILQFSKK